MGVVANTPKHFRTGNESIPQIKDLMLNIGASSSEEVHNRGVEVGDTIVPHTIMTQLSKNRYSAKAWDNRYGCVLAIEILELLKDIQLDVNLYVDANVQEEVGLRGAKAAVKQIDPDITFVIDCSPVNDIEGKQQLSGVLGEGTLVHIRDGTMILKLLFRDYLLKLAEENQIAYQYYISPGGIDGGEVHKENKGIPTAAIRVCTRCIHSTGTVFDIEDHFSARHLLKESIIHLTSEQIQQLQYGKEF